MLWTCGSCGTGFAVGLTACPHCRERYTEEGDMPKTTKLGGASHEDEPAPAEVAEGVGDKDADKGAGDDKAEKAKPARKRAQSPKGLDG